MVKKIFFYYILSSFLFFVGAFASESGGMPQLNPEFWAAQIFWLVLIFAALYIAISKIFLPRIINVIENRKLKIKFQMIKLTKIFVKSKTQDLVVAYLHSQNFALLILTQS